MNSKRLLVLLVSIAFVCVGMVGISTGASAAVNGSVQHPGGPVVGASAGSGLPTISENWSGYAATAAKKFNYVHSTFVQPAVTCPGVKNQWTSNWVGLDGFTNGTVEQDGTFAFCGGAHHMKPVYEAWFEMFPAGSVNVFKVKAGDVISATVRFSHGNFNLTVADMNSGKSASNSATCSQCERTSAEWIIERPALCNNSFTKCFITRLANFGTATMSKVTASVDGGKIMGAGGFDNVPIFMVDPVKGGGFISLDEVSGLSHQSFEAVFDRTGHTVPITL
jgi:hypothetical protein